MAIPPCPNCGKLNSPNAKFCAQCGTSLAVPEVPAVTPAGPTVRVEDVKPFEAPTEAAPPPFVPAPPAVAQAGPTVRVEDVKPYEAAPQVVPPPYVPAPPPQQSTAPYAPVAPVLACPSCGAANRTDAQRCGNCGYSFVPVAAPVAAPPGPTVAYVPQPRRQGSGWLFLPLLLLIFILAVVAAAAVGYLAAQLLGGIVTPDLTLPLSMGGLLIG